MTERFFVCPRGKLYLGTSRFKFWVEALADHLVLYAAAAVVLLVFVWT